MDASDSKLVVKMRAGSKTRFSNITDSLTLAYPAAGCHRTLKLGKVSVEGSVLIGVTNNYRVSIAAFSAAKDHLAITRRLDRGTDRRSVVNAFVRAFLAEKIGQ